MKTEWTPRFASILRGVGTLAAKWLDSSLTYAFSI